jgi:hypothetical protein
MILGDQVKFFAKSAAQNSIALISLVFSVCACLDLRLAHHPGRVEDEQASRTNAPSRAISGRLRCWRFARPALGSCRWAALWPMQKIAYCRSRLRTHHRRAGHDGAPAGAAGDLANNLHCVT